MTVEEFNRILDTEKFSAVFNRMNNSNKFLLLRMREIFSLSFNIPVDKLYSIPTYGIFFSSYINTKPEFEIDNIKLEIIHGVSDLTLALKYFEPIEVIQEIRDNLKNEIFILKTKIYTSKELTKVFNRHYSSMLSNKVLNIIKLNIKDSSKKLWLGNDIYNNLGPKLKVSGGDKIISKDEYNIPLNLLCEKTNSTLPCLYNRLRLGLKIFGVKVDYKSIKDTNTYIKESDYNQILLNMKYYMSIKDAKDILEYSSQSIIIRLNIYYLYSYGKKINFKSSYVKKEDIIKFKVILNDYNNNYIRFIDTLYNIITNSKVTEYDFKEVMGLLSYGKRSKNVELALNIKSVTISKLKLLEILDYTKLKSSKYKKEKI